MFRHRRNKRLACLLLSGILLTVLVPRLPTSSVTGLQQKVLFLSNLLYSPAAVLHAARQIMLRESSGSAPEFFSESSDVPDTGISAPVIASVADPFPVRFDHPLPDLSLLRDEPQPGPNVTAPVVPSACPSQPVSSAEPAPIPASAIPDGMAALTQRFYPQGHGAGYVACGASTVRNCTDLPDSEIAAEMMQPLPFTIDPKSAEPQVLIVHTHTTESYESQEQGWCDPDYTARTTDLTQNVAAVGDCMAAELEAAGIHTLHDKTLHDYPSYTESYKKSRNTVQSYLSRHPSIKVVVDLHRDAIQCKDGTRIKPAVEINGQKCAQVMLICGADLNGNLPNCRQNLRFASRWQDQMEKMFPGLTRPALFDYRFYNQDLSTGSLLIEIGGHANTLQEAEYAGSLAGMALAQLLIQPGI